MSKKSYAKGTKGGRKMYPPPHLQITPRHLFFNVLAQYKGRVDRQELIMKIYETGVALSKGGYSVSSLDFKGSRKMGYWSDEIDGELAHWVRSGLIQKEEPNVYIFVPQEEVPFDSLENLLRKLNRGLDARANKLLKKTVERIVQNR